MKTRREFIKMSALAGTAIAGASVATSYFGLPEPVIQTSANNQSNKLKKLPSIIQLLHLMVGHCPTE